MSLQRMQICPSYKRSQVQFVLSLQRDEEYIVIGHFHRMYRYSSGHGTQQREVIHVPCADCSILRPRH